MPPGYTEMCGRAYGQLFLTDRSDGGIWVARADPAVLIAHEWFEHYRYERPSPAVEVTIFEDWEDGPLECHPPVSGALLRIAGVNRKVVYRIGRFFPNVRMHEAEWPD